MRQPARALLGRRHRGLPMGYRVLTLERALYAPFTREGVTEAAPGYYVAAVEAPPAGGWIVWGTKETPSVAEAELLPTATPDLAPILEAQRALFDGLIGRIAEAIPTPPAPVVIVDTGPFEAQVAETRADLLAMTNADQEQRAADLAALRADLSATAARIAGLERLNESAQRLEALDSAAQRFVELTALAAQLVTAGLGVAELRGDVERLQESLGQMKRDAGDQERVYVAIDGLLATLEGGSRRVNASGRFH